ncbi:MAG: hypothetical protein Q7R86_00870 [bacterium]|nr:hypothetical protein [bacterium]
MKLPFFSTLEIRFVEIKKAIRERKWGLLIVYLLLVVIFLITSTFTLLTLYNSAFQKEYDRTHSASSINTERSNIAVGNSGPVNQTLTLNEPPTPLVQIIIAEPSDKKDDGLYHTEFNIGIGVVVGSREPELTSVSTQPEITCGPHYFLSSGLTAFGPLTGRIQYVYQVECTSESPISEDSHPEFTVNYNY